MAKSANNRRNGSRLTRWPDMLEPPRVGWGALAHLSLMDTFDAPTGLEPVLTTSQLAAHLGVSPQAIHDLRHLGRGPRGFRVGRELRYRVSAVEAWLAALEATDTTATIEPKP